ncbi:DNA-binding NarL/FixJ family response regulator [Arthrobacter sp. MP_M7]|nr:DNA-binding NarL/FixJ family response regulator [Arthrobacter sp. MP_M4]MEC5203858.1 DNA-binding NarL/FixJ family response regulator [Arthrobacter sp. MP_M7]
MGAGMDGVTATSRIKLLKEPPPVLILTTYDTDADILAAVEAGASGYMLKDAPPEQIHQAVLAAAAGQTALAPRVAALLMGRINNPAPSLTPREVQLLELLATGLSNRATAKQIFISEATVKTHLGHIYSKLGLNNRTAAIAAATQRRIIRPRANRHEQDPDFSLWPVPQQALHRAQADPLPDAAKLAATNPLQFRFHRMALSGTSLTHPEPQIRGEGVDAVHTKKLERP